MRIADSHPEHCPEEHTVPWRQRRRRILFQVTRKGRRGGWAGGGGGPPHNFLGLMCAQAGPTGCPLQTHVRAHRHHRQPATDKVRPPVSDRRSSPPAALAPPGHPTPSASAVMLRRTDVADMPGGSSQASMCSYNSRFSGHNRSVARDTPLKRPAHTATARAQRPQSPQCPRHPRSPPSHLPTHQNRIWESGKMGEMGGKGGRNGGGAEEIAGIAHGMWVVEGCGGMRLRKMGPKWGGGGEWGENGTKYTHFSWCHFPHFSGGRRPSPQFRL